MSGFEAPEWGSILLPDASLFESFVRGSLVYFAVLLLMRVAPKRQLGSVGLTDVLLLVLISECVSQALNAKSNSVVNGAVAVAALLFWDFVLDWAGYRWKWVNKLFEHCPVPLIRDGRPLTDRLKKERITHDELLGQLRLQGVDEVSRVKAAFLEPGGEVSVIRRDEPEETSPAADPTDFPGALDRFVAAARALRGAVEWHEAQSHEHAEAAKSARKALTQHGIVGKRLLDEDVAAHGAGRNGTGGG